MSFDLLLKKSAEKELKRIKGPILDKIDKALLQLMDDSKPLGSLKILGANDLYRIRCGDYRIIYEVNQEMKQIVVLAIANRKDAYKRKFK